MRTRWRLLAATILAASAFGGASAQENPTPFMVRPWTLPQPNEAAAQHAQRPSTAATITVPDQADIDAINGKLDKLGNDILQLKADVAKLQSGNGNPPPPPPPPAQFGISVSAPPDGASVDAGPVPATAAINGCVNVEPHFDDFSSAGSLTISGSTASGNLDLSAKNGPTRVTFWCWDVPAGGKATQTAQAAITLNVKGTGPTPPPAGALIDPVTKPGADRAGFTLTFNKEFKNSAMESGTVWRHDFYFNDRTLSGNGEGEYYVDKNYKGKCATAPGTDPFTLTGTELIITGRVATAAESACFWGYHYVSGLITTENSFSQQYGYFEMRAEMPEGKGLWPAFWLLPVDKSWPPELDPVEAFGGDNGRGEGGSNKYHYGAINAGGAWVTIPAGQNIYTGYHTYGIDWQASGLDFYFDGVKTGHTSNPSNKPMYMLANLAMKGNWPGNVDESKLPAKMHIDYIRAWKRNQ